MNILSNCSVLFVVFVLCIMHHSEIEDFTSVLSSVLVFIMIIRKFVKIFQEKKKRKSVDLLCIYCRISSDFSLAKQRLLHMKNYGPNSKVHHGTTLLVLFIYSICQK